MFFLSFCSEAIDLLTTISSLVIQLPPEFIAEAVNSLCDLYEDFTKLYSYKYIFLVNRLD